LHVFVWAYTGIFFCHVKLLDSNRFCWVVFCFWLDDITELL